MVAAASDYLSSARDQVSAGNRIFGTFVLAAAIWFIGTLFPSYFSERASKSLPSRISNLSSLLTQASNTCRVPVNRIIACGLEQHCDVHDSSETRDSTMERDQDTAACLSQSLGEGHQTSEVREFFGIRSSQVGGAVQTDLPRALSLGMKFLDRVQISRTCNARMFVSFTKWRAEVRKDFVSCAADKVALRTAVEDWTQENIDVGGLRVSNVSITWAPLILMLILGWGAMWLGLTRRRALTAFDAYFSDASINEPAARSEAPPSSSNPVMLTLPFWMVPLPGWEYRSGESLVSLLCPTPQRRWAAVRAIMAVLVFGLMIFAALHMQAMLSDRLLPLATPDQLLLADMRRNPFRLTGNAFVDLGLLATFPLLVLCIFWWVAEPVRARLLNQAPSRREFLRSALRIGLTISAALAPAWWVASGDAFALLKGRWTSSPYFRKHKRNGSVRDALQGSVLEKRVLELWTKGLHSEAIVSLRAELASRSSDLPPALRLHDLLAGLLVRAGREEELMHIPELTSALGREINRLETLLNQAPRNKLGRNSKRHLKSHLKASRAIQKLTHRKAQLVSRLGRWAAADGAWRSAWRPNVSRTWNKIDI